MKLSTAAGLGLLSASALALLTFACFAIPQESTPAPAPAPAPTPAPTQEQPAPAAAERAPLAPPRNTYFLGHSLTADVSDFVTHFARAAGKPFDFREQSILGSPLRWHWDEVERAKKPGYHSPFQPPHGAAYFNELPKGTFDALVMVDSVPRGGKELEEETVEYLVRFTELARKANPKIRVLFYEPWHCIHSGTEQGCHYDTSYPTTKLPWRERVEADGLMWDRIVATANAKLSKDGAPIESIPMARALGKLADAIEAGEVEGFKSWQELFVDDIHLTNPGKFFAGLVTYTVLFQHAPDRMPVPAVNRWGTSYWDQPNWQGLKWSAPLQAAARAMEKVAASLLPSK